MTALRCVDKQCLDGPPVDGEKAARLATHGYLCTRCSDALERRLAELPARRDLLRDTLGGTQGTRGENKPTKGFAPVPLSIDTHDLLVEMQAVTVTWVQLVCEERNLRGPDSSDLRRLAPWLVSQHSWIIEQPWVDDLGEEMRDLAYKADGLTRHKARWERLQAPCPECRAFELYRWTGQDEVICQSCGTDWKPEPYALRVSEVVHEETLTAAQAAKRLDIPASTVRRWVADPEHKLKPIGKDANGVNRYDPQHVENARETA